MSSFSDAVALFKTTYDTLATGDATLTVDAFLVGERFVHEQRAAGDVVWVNPGGEFTPHPGAGPVLLDDDTMVSPMLMDDLASFECFAWGADEDSAKGIMVTIINAMAQTCGWDNFKVKDYIAVTEEEDKGGYGWSGFSYMLRGSIRLIMVKEIIGTAEITETETTGDYE